MPLGFAETYYQSTVIASQWEQDTRMFDFPVAANQVIPEWGIVAQQTGASTDDVQTLSNTATGGTFLLTVGNALTKATSALACTTLTAAQLQAALNAAFATLCPGGPSTGYVAVTGGPFTAGAGSLTVTFNSGVANTGLLASNNQTLMVVNNGNATGGSVTVAHTTVGVNQGGLVNYNGAIAAAPVTAPTLTATGTAGTIGAGTYEVAYTLVTGSGETTASDGAFVTLTATQSVQVTSITGLPSYVSGVNFYLDGAFVKTVAPTGGATGTVLISAAPSAGAKPVPSLNTAYQASDGSQIPVGIAWYAMASGPNGQITYGGSSPTGNSWSYPGFTGNVAVKGWYSAANINSNSVSPLDQNTISTLGRLVNGSLSNLTNATFAIYGG
jgi:hypothetical protein